MCSLQRRYQEIGIVNFNPQNIEIRVIFRNKESEVGANK